MPELLTATVDLESIRFAEVATQHSVGAIAAAKSVEHSREIIQETEQEVFANTGLTEKPLPTDTLIDAWMDKPAASLLDELRDMQTGFYKARTIVRSVGDHLVSECVTRSPERNRANGWYRLSRKDGEVAFASVITDLDEQFDGPAVIRYHAATDRVSVEAQIWRRGRTQEVPLPTGQGEVGDMVQRASFANTIWAGRLAMIRPPEVQAEANQKAMVLLASELAARPAVYLLHD